MRRFSLREFELPEITDNELLVSVISDSVCLSTWKAALLGSEHKRVPDDLENHPVITGHECAGVIVEVGKNLTGKYKKGQRFVLQPAMGLPSGYSAGYSYEYFGGNATYMIIPEIAINLGCVLPYHGSYFAAASLAEPMCCIIGAYHANYHTTQYVYEHRMGVKPGGNIALLACAGPMGIGAIDYAINGGIQPSRVVVVDIDDKRLAQVQKLLPVDLAASKGIELVYVNTKGMSDPVQTLRALTGDVGFDDIFVYAAVPAVVEMADELLAEDGCLNFFAGPTDKNFKVPFNFYNVGLQETVNQASGALQKNQNGADIPGKDTFTKNIGACRAYSAWLNIGGDSQVWTTAQFISWLESQGAFNHPYWMCKGSWAYANNKVITDTGCGNICLAGAVVEVIGTRGAMTIRVTTPSTSSGGGITNAQFTYINHGDAYAPGWRRDYNTKNQQPAFALGQTGSTVGNDKAVGWNWNSGVYNANIGGASTLILHFNMNTGSCPAVQFRVNYRNGGIFYRSARDGYGFEADWSEFYTTTRKPSAGDVGAYTQAECNSRFITGIRLGGLSSVQTWNGPGWSDRSGYVVTGSVNGNRDELIDTTQARPIQYCINGTWYNAGSI